MPQDTQEVLLEIKQSLVELKTEIKNIMPTVDLKLNNIEEKIRVANHRIEDLEEQNKWLWRTIIAAIVVAIVPLFLK